MDDCSEPNYRNAEGETVAMEAAETTTHDGDAIQPYQRTSLREKSQTRNEHWSGDDDETMWWTKPCAHVS